MIDKVAVIKIPNPIHKKTIPYEVRISVRAIALITLSLILVSMLVTNIGMSITNEVMVERIASLSLKLDDLSKSYAARDFVTGQIVKDIAEDVVAIKVSQSSQETKINIMWGILGTVFAGAVVSSLYIRKKNNGKAAPPES